MTKTLTLAEQEFLKAFKDIKPISIIEEYRAYYDNDGWVQFYAANKFPDVGTWVNISREQYVLQDHQWLRYVDGVLIKQLPTYSFKFALTRSDNGVKVVKNHAGIVLESGEAYAETEYYDTNN
jgi:hypothetical protein